jgi:hypothetical protein
VICLVLCLLGLIAGAVTLEREIHMQRVEVSR